MATNDFKPFAIAPSANVTDQADYAALPAVLSGFGSGVASSAQVNKALRQSTVLASVLAQFISNQLTVDVLDNGDTTTLLNNLIAALNSNGAASFLQKANNFSEIKAAGAVAQAAALTNLGSSDGTLKGRLLNIQIFTSSSNYTPTPGTNKGRVRGVGAGGGGGGCPACGASLQATAFGGQSGAYAEAFIPINSATVYPITIGAAGIGGAPGSNNGTNGGTTSFGTILSIPGGTGGNGAGSAVGGGSAATLAVGTTGTVLPTLSTGTLLVAKLSTTNGVSRFIAGTTTATIKGGDGGSSPFGNSGYGGSQSAGSPGDGYGTGGGGAAQGSSGPAEAGGNGTPGYMIIEEYA
jgi:hypothetical protein